MIATHCRHMTYPKPGGALPKRCAAGVEYASIQRDDLPAPLWNRRACYSKGRALGCTCPSFAPWTPEEVAADEAETQRALAAVDEGLCPSCGARMVERGNWLHCRACPDVAVHFHRVPR
jgi:hypothetical protein